MKNIINSKFQIPKFLNSYTKGLTLIELLVVMVILGILATIGFGQYRTSQLKARDAQRKGDLDNIGRALEMYYNDFQSYPLSSNGLMQVDTDGDGTLDNLDWGGEFSTPDVIYMKSLPEDPADDYGYCYQSDAEGSEYQIYSVLENERDADYFDSYVCNGEDYNYGVSSSNTSI